MSTTYAFRDSDVAARRLELLARIFEPTTRAFLREEGPRGAQLALDLGCGTGQTTRLLAELGPRRLVGLDTSRAFVEEARRNGLDVIEHDVTATPFPPGRPDLAFCRFLLTHLAGPRTMVARWTCELRPGGLLLAEEVEGIETADPAFIRYLDTVDGLVRPRGGTLAVGPLLPMGRTSRVVTVEPDPLEAARMFALNLAAWRDELDGSLYEELAAGLREPGHEPITWRLRQAVYEATP